MIKITPLGSSFVFLTTVIWLANTDEKVLMVMTSGDGSDINSLWNTEGGVNETTPEMADWPVRELLSHGTFRSSVVDLWPYGIPEHMTLEAVNAVGTPLWWVMLSTSGTDKSLTSWLKPTLMLTSSSHDMIETSDRTIYLEEPYLDVSFGLASNKNMSWFYVDQSGQSHPKFYLTRNSTSSQDMYPSASGTDWWDDYVFKILARQQTIQVDLSEFSDTGNSYIFLTRQTVNAFKFFTSYKILYNIYFGMLPCNDTDWGDPYLDETGKTMNFTTKISTNPIYTSTVHCLTINFLEPIPDGASISFTGRTITEQFVEAHALVILGYWPNGTFPTDLSTTATTTTTVAPTTTTTTAPTTATSTTTTTPATSTTSPTSTASPTTALTTTITSPTTALTTITTSQTTTTHTTTTTPIITTTSTTTTTAMTTGLQHTTNNEQSSTVTETTTKTPKTQGHTSSSTDIMATSEGTNQGSAAENTAQCVCACSIKNVTALTTEELQQKLAQLRKELTVNYTELSSYFRKLNSMPDSRPSAQGIGIIGVGLIALFIFFIIFLDLQFLVRTAQTMRYSFGGNSINSI